MTVRFELTPAQVRALDVEGFIRVPLPTPAWLPDGNLATSVLVGRVGGGLRAYANVCRHHPFPLDEEGYTLLSKDGVHLVCRSHGAMYRTDDGECDQGPCGGEALFRARIVEDAGQVWGEI